MNRSEAPSPHLIIGIDCATQPENVGLALGRHTRSGLIVEEVERGSKRRDPASVILAWLKGRPQALLAFDAPLGWPAALGPALSQHRAGAYVAVPPDRLFRRTTDEYVETQLKKRPMEVGANRIARTAIAALRLLQELRVELGQEIPLAWDWASIPDYAAIEVYPAATLMARGGMRNGADVLSRLRGEVKTPESSLLSSCDHVRDAVLCALAATDFMNGQCAPPEDRDSAEKEGWIWARRRS